MTSVNFLSCKGCQDRHVGCHSSCEKYLTAKAECERRRLERFEKKKIDSMMTSYEAESRARIRKNNVNPYKTAKKIREGK